jgi:hypothetical protein
VTGADAGAGQQEQPVFGRQGAELVHERQDRLGAADP